MTRRGAGGRWAYKLPLRLRSLWGKQRLDAELAAEIEFHLERQTEENAARGMAPREARQAALRALGGVEQIKEECRAMRRVGYLENLLQDLRYGIRSFGRNRGLTAVAVLTLALGIGANTAIFSVIHGVLLLPLPYPRPDRIVSPWQATPSSGDTRLGLSEAQLVRLRAGAAPSLAEVGGYLLQGATLAGGPGVEPERIAAAWVSAGVCEALATAPALGRCVRASDESGGEIAAVLADGLWRRRFGGDPGIVGRTVQIDGRPTLVVGVMPGGFALPEELAGGEPAQLYRSLPITAGKLNWGSYYLRPVARLRDGASPARALAEVLAVFAALRRENPGAAIDAPDYAVRVVPLRDDLVGDVRAALWVLLGAVAAVLLIACANVASLLLARAAERQREMAVRAALGAGAGRLVRQLLAESLLIALAGGAVGVGLAAAGLSVIARGGAGAVPRLGQVGLSLPVLFFTLAVCVFAAVLFGLVPAAQIAGLDLHRPLREDGRGTSAGRGRHRLQSILVVTEVAMASMLVIGAGLLLRSFAQLSRVDPGFAPHHLLAVQVNLPRRRYGENQRTTAFYRQLLERLRSLPGVQAAGAPSAPPLGGPSGDTRFQIEGGTPAGGGTAGRPAGGDAGRHVYTWLVTPGYFQAVGLTLVRGRPLLDADGPASPLVLVVNETLARAAWPGRDPLGKRLRLDLGPAKMGPWIAVAGVVRPVTIRGLDEAPQPEAFLPEAQGMAEDGFPATSMNLIVRTAGEPLALAAAVRRAVSAADPAVPVSHLRTGDELVAHAAARSRFNLALLALFAAVALAMAAAGIYAILANAVRLRSREIGIRKALGAGSREVLRLLVGQAMRLTLAGLALGLAAAAGLTRFQQSLLFGVRPTDPLTFAGVALLLCAVALAACGIPARRALAVDPVEALRSE
ncbi:MAG TPA: ABC transporter permease [Thermoanaerobaculia bacterium]|nr:ABC transporter permease [Thermoanaerobaculia bacterium]